VSSENPDAGEEAQVKADGASITPAAIAAYQAGNEMALHAALGLRPWEISPLSCDGLCPYSPGTAGAETWPQAQALRGDIERRLANP
jgi:hypothetical protein